MLSQPVKVRDGTPNYMATKMSVVVFYLIFL